MALTKQQIKSILMPLAMLTGGVFHTFFTQISWVIPYLIFGMLFVTYCRVSFRDMHFSSLYIWLAALQIFGSIAVYMAVRPLLGDTVAQGSLICVFAPVATAAVVVAGMLGANVATMATYSLLSNLLVAAVAPIVFSLVGSHAELDFGESFLLILSKVGPLLVGPLLGAWLLGTVAPRLHETIKSHQQISFYLWVCSLTTVSGRTVGYIIQQGEAEAVREVILAVAALLLCLVQFGVGRRLGRRYGDTVAGGQSLGQKNTVLAIWMAQTYLEPVSSVAPAAYVLWQNLVNSYQIARKKNLQDV